MRVIARAVALGGLLVAPLLARAHDSWLELQPPTPNGELVLTIGTGAQFPTYQTPIRIEQVDAAACHDAADPGARPEPLRRLRDRGDALVLRSARPLPPVAARSCRVQLVPIELRVEPAIVPGYFDEIRAPDALRERWEPLAKRGVPFDEVYVKHARIEIDGPPDDPGPTTSQPLPLGMDVTFEAPRRPIVAGDEVAFTIRRDGRPLAGQMVELRSDTTPVGFWHRSDDAGRVRQALPLPGRWLVRAVELEADPTRLESWRSRFVTLIVTVKAR